MEHASAVVEQVASPPARAEAVRALFDGLVVTESRSQLPSFCTPSCWPLSSSFPCSSTTKHCLRRGRRPSPRFLVAPPELAPPPPPAAPRLAVKRIASAKPIEGPSFVAPIESPTQIKPEEGLDLGVEGGVPGGVDGGVPGGVGGGIVGGLPQETAAPTVVRIGGKIVAPKLVHEVKPVYPSLARAAHASAVIIMEAQVGLKGEVKAVRVLRGHPLLDDAAADAVRQWRYQPLLLNGEPKEFILTVTLVFNLRQG